MDTSDTRSATGPTRGGPSATWLPTQKPRPVPIAERASQEWGTSSPPAHAGSPARRQTPDLALGVPVRGTDTLRSRSDGQASKNPPRPRKDHGGQGRLSRESYSDTQANPKPCHLYDQSEKRSRFSCFHNYSPYQKALADQSENSFLYPA